MKTKIGDVHKNKSGLEFEVIEIVTAKKIKIRFKETMYEVYSTGENLRAGLVKDRFHRSVHGVGYLGDNKADVKNTRVGRTWSEMIRRCYSPESRNYHSYGAKGVIVCNEWHNFSVFEKWYEEHCYKVEGWHVDKDILAKSGVNKIYSPETCCFVPQELNGFFKDVSEDSYGVLFYKNGKDSSKRYQSGPVGKEKFGGNQYFYTQKEALENSLFKKGLKIYDVLLKYEEHLEPRVFETIKQKCGMMMCQKETTPFGELI